VTKLKYTVNGSLQALTDKYQNWCLIDMPYNMSYREYQMIRKPLVAKMAEFRDKDVVFALSADGQAIQIMTALMQLNAKFVVVLTRRISDVKNMYMRRKLKQVIDYDKGFVLQHSPNKANLIKSAQNLLNAGNRTSHYAVKWANNTLADPDKADFLDGIKHREAEFKHIISKTNSAFISIYRDKPQYLAKEVQGQMSVWNIDLNHVRRQRA